MICLARNGRSKAVNRAAGGEFLLNLNAAWRILLTVILMVALFCAFTQPAYAYADPGSGLLAVQIIGSSFAGLIFLIRGRLRRIFGTKHSGPKSEDAAQK